MVARNRYGRYQRTLPEILIIDLGHRHVKLAAETILQALDSVTLVFERMRLGELQLQGQDTDGRHSSGSRRQAAGCSETTAAAGSVLPPAACLLPPVLTPAPPPLLCLPCTPQSRPPASHRRNSGRSNRTRIRSSLRWRRS